MSAFYYFSKYTFSRHDAVTHPFIDLAVAVAILPDLRHFQNRISDSESGSDRKIPKIISFNDQVFAKCSQCYIRTFFSEFLYFFIRKKADLPVPVATVGIFFPCIIAAILKTAQGSSTVAITTTAGILGLYSAEGSLMSALGLTSPFAAALTVMAIGAGAMTVSHANDSYFWVVTNFGGMKAEDGYKTQTMCTLLMGLASIVFIWIISLFFH